MSMFGSFGRWLNSLFGQVEGKTQRAADAMVTGSAESIRNQFRVIRDARAKDYLEMKRAVADLSTIQDGRKREHGMLQAAIVEREHGMNGSIVEFKRTQDERFKTTYALLGEEKEGLEQRAALLWTQIGEQAKVLDTYVAKLKGMDKEIDNLKKEEAETVADITSQRQLADINNRLQGMSQNTNEKNLIAMREARASANSMAKLDTALTTDPSKEFIDKVKASGTQSKYLSAFESATKLDTVFADTPKAIESPKQSDGSSAKNKTLDSLFD